MNPLDFLDARPGRLRAYCAILLLCWHAAAGQPIQGQDFALTQDGEPSAFIYAPGPNEWAGWRLHQRILEWTSTSLPVYSEELPPAGSDIVAVGTPETNSLVRDALVDVSGIKDLAEQGYLLQVLTRDNARLLVATGNTLEGVNHAVSELLSWQLRIRNNASWVLGDLNQSEKPGLKYRLLWGQADDIWAPSLQETIEIQAGRRTNPSVGSREGFLDFTRRAVDYLADHKLNGYVWYYVLDDKHGGISAAQEMSRYARHNNVRVLPGVATMTAYHGFSMNADHIYNFKEWNRLHPELRLVNRAGEFEEGICPSKPENQQWLRDGMAWYLGNLPDLGGVNLENGDWIICWCKECEAARHREENDPNFFRDQMATYKPCIEKGNEVRPDMLMTFAAYSGFSEAAVGGAMSGAKQTKRAAGDSERIVYPPKILNQLPEGAICQWTLTGMASPASWPEGLRPPKNTFKEQIGLIHHGSPWWAPLDKARWWADKGPYSTWDEISELIGFMCSRISTAEMHGLVIKAIIGASAPAKDLNFLALEYFGWRPGKTYEQFINERLSVALGDRQHAIRFLELIRDTTRDPEAIEQAAAEAGRIAGETQSDPRVAQRWRNLSVELTRRAGLAHAGLPVDGAERVIEIRPNGAQDGYVVTARSEAVLDDKVLLCGTQDGRTVTPVSLHPLFGFTAPDVMSATLRIPLNEHLITPHTAAWDVDWTVQHIAAADNTRVTAADAISAGLGAIGTYRKAGSPGAGAPAFVELDVTEQLKADIQAGRKTFAWRLETGGDLGHAQDSRFAFPAVENMDANTSLNQRGARLIIKLQSMVGP